MSQEEENVLIQLGINGTGAIAQQHGACSERGSHAQDRGTYHMCHSCKYLILLSTE